MDHKAVAKCVALFRGNDLPEFFFDFAGLFDVVYKAYEVAESDAVGVGDDGGFAIDVSEDEVGAFAANAGEF